MGGLRRVLPGPASLARIAGAHHRRAAAASRSSRSRWAASACCASRPRSRRCRACELAGVGARDEIRRYSEDALTSARLLASRPTLLRLVRAGQTGAARVLRAPLLRDRRPRRLRRRRGRRPCSRPRPALPLGRAGRTRARSRASASSWRRRRRRTACSAPPPTIAALPGTRVVVLRAFDRRLADGARRAGRHRGAPRAPVRLARHRRAGSQGAALRGPDRRHDRGPPGRGDATSTPRARR